MSNWLWKALESPSKSLILRMIKIRIREHMTYPGYTSSEWQSETLDLVTTIPEYHPLMLVMCVYSHVLMSH